MAGIVVETIAAETIAAEMALEQERAYLEHLLAKGIIASLPNRYREGYVPDEYARHPPIVVQGEPVSETVLRERR